MACLALAACAGQRPARGGVVSADYCADLVVTSLLPPERIASLSPEIGAEELAPAYRALPRVRARLEEVVALRPDVVVRSYGGGPRLGTALAAAGVRTLSLESSSSLDEVAGETIRLGRELGASEAAERQVRALRSARHAPAPGSYRDALYLTPGSVTSGPDGLIGELFREAQLRSVEQRPGWHALPVERLARHRPDVVVRAFWDSPRHRQDRWSAAVRPTVATMLDGVPSIELDGRSVACGTAHVTDALQRLKGIG